LSILRGEIEALQDGIRPADPKALDSLHTEIMQLSRLVDDLYQLSLFDVGALSYHKEPIELFAIVKQTIELFRVEFARKQIALATTFPSSSAKGVFGDPERFQQLFSNLLDNSLKYTNPSGKLTIIGKYSQGRCQITFQDSAPGVPLAEHEKLFDRLYRVESSRNRSTGGMGLGLTICQNIIKAHEGSISAGQSPFGGLQINISIPLIKEL
jgi:two-component system, OmpR family, sensor histidine kinase BaeS